jgi:hypothetical protein
VATLHQKIAEAFLKELDGRKEFDAEKLARLKELLARKSKLKATELVDVFSMPPGGELK